MFTRVVYSLSEWNKIVHKYVTRIIHFEYRFNIKGYVRADFMPLSQQIPLGPITVAVLTHPVLSALFEGLLPGWKQHSSKRLHWPHIMQSCRASAWQCNCVPPKPPKTSVSHTLSVPSVHTLCCNYSSLSVDSSSGYNNFNSETVCMAMA